MNLNSKTYERIRDVIRAHYYDDTSGSRAIKSIVLHLYNERHPLNLIDAMSSLDEDNRDAMIEIISDRIKYYESEWIRILGREVLGIDADGNFMRPPSKLAQKILKVDSKGHRRASKTK